MPPMRRGNKYFSTALIITVIIISFVIFPIRSFIGQVASSIMRPLFVSGQWLSNQFTKPSMRQVVAERDQLRQQVEDLSSRLNEINQQLDIQQNLSALVDYSHLIKHQLILAAVTGVSPDLGIKSLTINRGQRDGVSVGQAAVTEHGILVGKVTAVADHFSTILLITDRQSLILAEVQNDKKSPGVIRGERGLSLQLEYIPKDDSLKIGQTVVTNGNETNIPSNILIGTISKINYRPGDLFQSATVIPAAKLSQLKVVGIIAT